MDSSAFGSPVVVHNIVACGETERLSARELFAQVCFQRLQYNHTIDIESQQRNDKVKLLSEGGHIVGSGVVDNSYKRGVELNHLKLFP